MGGNLKMVKKKKRKSQNKLTRGIRKAFRGSFKGSKRRSVKRSRAGRPKGPSGRYYIPERGFVGVYEYRRWLQRKMAIQRLQATRQPTSKEVQEAPRRGNILNAPNFMRGELREVKDKGVVIKHFDTLQNPITNRYGDEYLEVDPISGKPILRKRLKERWATGEAR
jgi:hypothetical protein